MFADIVVALSITAAFYEASVCITFTPNSLAFRDSFYLSLVLDCGGVYRQVFVLHIPVTRLFFTGDGSMVSWG